MDKIDISLILGDGRNLRCVILILELLRIILIKFLIINMNRNKIKKVSLLIRSNRCLTNITMLYYIRIIKDSINVFLRI